MTDNTITFLFSKVKTSRDKEAFKKVQDDYLKLKSAKAGLKTLEAQWKKKGYIASSSSTSYNQSKTRYKHVITSLPPFLNAVTANKSNPLVFFYILSNPKNDWDYHHGTIQGFLPFHESAWKRKYIKKTFREKE